MKKILFLFGILSSLVSCSQSKADYYFDFDKVEHYSIVIDLINLLDISNNGELSEKEKLQIELVLEDKPKTIVDTLFIKDLERIGFQKQHIDEIKRDFINEIFRFKAHNEIHELECISVYRDILIFRKNDKIVGMAKICFDCSQNQIVGTDVNTIHFGQSGDYGKLAQILNEESR